MDFTKGDFLICGVDGVDRRADLSGLSIVVPLHDGVAPVVDISAVGRYLSRMVNHPAKTDRPQLPELTLQLNADCNFSCNNCSTRSPWIKHSDYAGDKISARLLLRSVFHWFSTARDFELTVFDTSGSNVLPSWLGDLPGVNHVKLGRKRGACLDSAVSWFSNESGVLLAAHDTAVSGVAVKAAQEKASGRFVIPHNSLDSLPGGKERDLGPQAFAEVSRLQNTGNARLEKGLSRLTALFIPPEVPQRIGLPYGQSSADDAAVGYVCRGAEAGVATLALRTVAFIFDPNKEK